MEPADELFAFISNNGVVQYDGVKGVVSCSPEAMDEADLEALFQTIDLDEEGVLSREGFAELLDGVAAITCVEAAELLACFRQSTLEAARCRLGSLPDLVDVPLPDLTRHLGRYVLSPDFVLPSSPAPTPPPPAATCDATCQVHPEDTQDATTMTDNPSPPSSSSSSSSLEGEGSLKLEDEPNQQFLTRRALQEADATLDYCRRATRDLLAQCRGSDSDVLSKNLTDIVAKLNWRQASKSARQACTTVVDPENALKDLAALREVVKEKDRRMKEKKKKEAARRRWGTVRKVVLACGALRLRLTEAKPKEVHPAESGLAQLQSDVARFLRTVSKHMSRIHGGGTSSILSITPQVAQQMAVLTAAVRLSAPSHKKMPSPTPAPAPAAATPRPPRRATPTRLDVTRFGAKGDGLTDDTPALHKAAAAAARDPSCEVYFPPGQYVLDPW